ncbi:MAG: DMT family transporter [Thermoplasmatota archaeon]
MPRHPGVVAALAAAALFGAATPATKPLLGNLSPLLVAGLLYLGAAVATAPSVWRTRHARHANGGLRLAGAVLFGGILAPVFLLLALAAAQAASISMWLNLEVVATSLLGVTFFRDELGRMGWAAVACVLAGAIALSWGSVAGTEAALLVAAAALCWGLDNNLTALIDGIHPSETTFWKGLAGGSVNLSLGLALHAGPLPGTAVALALVVGMVSYGASITLFIRAAHSMGAARAQLLFATSPLWGVAGAVLFLHEGLRLAHGVAALLMAMGLLLLHRDRHNHAHAHEAMAHTHSHRHDDGHHTHVHPGYPLEERHVHWHEHEPMRHRHAHWPDLHHRHRH